MNNLSEKMQDKYTEALGRCQRDQDFLEAEKIAQALGDLLNGGSRNPIMLGLLSGMQRQHRYLQNEATWVLLEALGRLPDIETTDARNESSIEACRNIRETLSERIYWEGL